jgi:fibronectin type 3 domain-containing protein
MMKRSIILLTALLLAAISGCDRYIESRDPVRSLPEDVPVPVNVMAEVNGSGTVTLYWEVTDTAEVKLFRIFVADSTDSDYRLYDSTTGFSATLSRLLVNRRYFFKVAAVTRYGLQGDWSEAVTARPTLFSISIENGKEYINKREVQIRVNAPTGTSHLMLSEDSTFADASFVSFTGAPASFTLSEGDGVKTVYARLQFSDGSRSGELLQDDIILDTHAAVDSVFFTPVGVTFSPGDTVLFGLDAGETGGEASASFTGVSRINLYDDGTNGDPIEGDGIYRGRWVVPVDFTLYNGVVTGSFQDRAGNSALPVTAQQVLNVNSPPQPVTLSAAPLSTFEIVLSWTKSNSADFASYRIYRSTNAAVSESSELVTTITNVNTTGYTDDDLNDNTTYYYRVFVYNNSNLSSGSNTASAKTKTNSPPEAVELFAIVQSDNTVDLVWSKNNEADFASYRLYKDHDTTQTDLDSLRADLLSYIDNRNTSTFTDSLPDTLLHYYQVYVVDKHGASTASNVVSAKRQ